MVFRSEPRHFGFASMNFLDLDDKGNHKHKETLTMRAISWNPWAPRDDGFARPSPWGEKHKPERKDLLEPRAVQHADDKVYYY